MDTYYHEVVFTIRLEKDIPMRQIQSVIAEFISAGMMFDEQIKEMHHKNQYKRYLFCAPYPLEQDRVYRKDRMYCFNLRTQGLRFALVMKDCLPKVKGVLKVISAEIKNYSQKRINELTSLTPIICTVNNRCWMPENGIALLASRLHGNAAKKCKELDPAFTEQDELFFERIELLNHKPIIVDYKGATLLGHKVRLNIRPNDWAQRLAFTALGGGLGEKGPIGFGYCVLR